MLLFGLIPVACMILGGIIATFRPAGPRLTSAILHFAGGVIFSVVAVELLPDIRERHAPLEVIIGFGAGIIAMTLIKHFSEKVPGRESTRGAIPYGLLTGVAIDIFIDGLLLGIGFAAGDKEGIMLAAALAVEILSLGLATGTSLVRSGISRGTIILLVAGTGTLFFVGAVISTTLSARLSTEVLEIVLSFGLSALLYLVTEELLREAHEEPETPLLTSAFFIGFLLFLILGMVI